MPAEDPIIVYRAEQARVWLKDVKRSISLMHALEAELSSVSDRYDMVKGASYEDMRRPTRATGDDAIVHHLLRLERMMDGFERSSLEYAGKVADANRIFQQLTSHEYAGEVLTRRFILGQGWEQIAKELIYTRDSIMKIARRAEAECYEYMPSEYRDEHAAI